MIRNARANMAPRGARAKALENAETGIRNDIIIIILVNGASYVFKERVVPDYHSRSARKPEEGHSTATLRGL